VSHEPRAANPFPTDIIIQVRQKSNRSGTATVWNRHSRKPTWSKAVSKPARLWRVPRPARPACPAGSRFSRPCEINNVRGPFRKAPRRFYIGAETWGHPCAFCERKCFCKSATYVNFDLSKTDQKRSKSYQKRSKTIKNSKKRHDFVLPILTFRRATPSGASANAVFDPPRGLKHLFWARKLT
jgi:hypothetical protein